MTNNVLVVDNELGILDVVAYALRQDGFPVIKATSTEEALSRLSNYNIATAIMDISLPDMDGMELYHTIRGTASHKHLPLHMLSVLDETMPARYTWGQHDYPVASLAINTFGDLVKHNLAQANTTVCA